MAKLYITYFAKTPVKETIDRLGDAAQLHPSPLVSKVRVLSLLTLRIDLALSQVPTAASWSLMRQATQLPG